MIALIALGLIILAGFLMAIATIINIALASKTDGDISKAAQASVWLNLIGTTILIISIAVGTIGGGLLAVGYVAKGAGKLTMDHSDDIIKVAGLML